MLPFLQTHSDSRQPPRQTQHVGTWFKAIRDRKMVSGNSGKNVIYTILEILVFSFGVTAVEKLEKLRYSNDDLLVLVLDFQTKSQQSWVCGRHHSCNRSMAWFVVGMTPSYVGRTQIDIAMWSPPRARIEAGDPCLHIDLMINQLSS